MSIHSFFFFFCSSLFELSVPTKKIKSIIFLKQFFKVRTRDCGFWRRATKSSKHQGWTKWILLIQCVNHFQSVRRIKEKKETTKEASVGASLALGCFLKKASPQLGFPNIIPLSFDRTQYLDSYF